jgi:lysophospholipase L1-like esterase
MAALGDSISQAFNTHADPAAVPQAVDLTACPDGLGVTGFPLDCPPNSWSTGTNPAVNSEYLRLVAANPDLEGHQANFAVSGAKVSDLSRQARQAVAQGAQYVTVEIGINDVCAPTLAGQTPVTTLHDQFKEALSTLSRSPAHPVIQVVSIPNVFHAWQLFHDDPNARLRWNLTQTCQALFANPTSTELPDVARRLAVVDRVVAYNRVEADVCRHTPRCTTDGGAVFAQKLSRDDIATVANTGSITNVPILAVLPVIGPGIPNSTGDYFHPSVVGQAAIASLAWQASPFAAVLRGERGGLPGLANR